MTEHVDHLLIGGGVASAACAEALRERGAEGSVALLTRELEPPYHRPVATKDLLRGESARADAYVHDEAWYAGHDIDLRLRTNARGIDIGEKIAEFKKNLDDYNAILLESLADRLAEAFAERMHERVRKEFWAHAPHEALSNDDLIKEKYDGIRPAPGYPACPEHTEKQTIWELLDVEANTGIELTESMAMWPGAAVSGLYFSHPESQYFVLGRIGRDQVEDYAERKGWTLDEAEKWLSPNLGYRTENE